MRLLQSGRAVKAVLPGSVSSDVLVETANRYQGLERDLTLVWHPLRGRIRTGAFHFDAGPVPLGAPATMSQRGRADHATLHAALSAPGRSIAFDRPAR